MKTIFYLAIVSLLLISCAKEHIRPEGPISVEMRNTPHFNGIYTSGANPIYISYGPEFKVEVKGSQNLLPYFKTTVKNNVLMLAYQDVRISDDNIEVFVIMPQINHVTLSGSGKMKISGSYPDQQDFEATINGSGNIRVIDTFDSKNTHVQISGSGNASLYQINSQKAEVEISGSGRVQVSVQDELTAKISGSGEVYYKGSPKMDSKISGSGKVIQQ